MMPMDFTEFALCGGLKRDVYEALPGPVRSAVTYFAPLDAGGNLSVSTNTLRELLVLCGFVADNLKIVDPDENDEIVRFMRSGVVLSSVDYYHITDPAYKPIVTFVLKHAAALPR